MALPPSFLDDLRDRLTLSEIVGRSVPLKRKGREWTACCPFHKEKSPSFFVNDEKGFYHCFGCAKNGDHISYLMEAEGHSFMDAVRELAGLAGMQVPELDPQEVERAKARKSLSEVMELVTKFFEVSLRGPEGEAARAYLGQRGIVPEIVTRFRLGYAPTGMLVPAMAQRGVKVEDLVRLGLLRVYDDRPKPVEVFRDRLMYPIMDPRGGLIAFGGRILGKGEPKYLNSPETELFHKGNALYGLSQAKRAALDANEIIVTEGYMDVLALAQAGYAQAVAPLGTAITESQLRHLWKLVPTPTLALDGDRAGRAAAARVMERALPLLKPGLSLKFAWLPEGEDPDSLIRSGGLAALSPILNQAIPLSEFLWQSYFAQDPGTPELRAGAWRDLGKAVEAITDPALKASFVADMEARYEQAFGVRQAVATTAYRKKPFIKPKKPLKPYERLGLAQSSHLNAQALQVRHEFHLVQLILAAPQWAVNAIADPGDLRLRDGDCQALMMAFFAAAMRLDFLDKDTLRTHLQTAGLGGQLARIDQEGARLALRAPAADASEEEFRPQILDVWAKVTLPARRSMPKLS